MLRDTVRCEWMIVDRPWRRSPEGFKQWLVRQVLARAREPGKRRSGRLSRRPRLGPLTTDVHVPSGALVRQEPPLEAHLMGGHCPHPLCERAAAASDKVGRRALRRFPTVQCACLACAVMAASKASDISPGVRSLG